MIGMLILIGSIIAAIPLVLAGVEVVRWVR